MTTPVLLVLNVGSSSIKFQVFERESLAVLMAGKVTGIGTSAQLTAALAAADDPLRTPLPAADHNTAMAAVMKLIDQHDDGWRLAAVVHRVVHGGAGFREPVVVTPEIVAQLQALAPLAPLHQPHNLAGIAASQRLASHALDIACFDTAFHAPVDPLFQTFALPQALRAQGVRRYGFHGLSYEWLAHEIARTHPDLRQARVVAAHLGNGASLCAMHGGRSVDTTMGMTALDGLPMGTRSGAVDAGAVIYLQRELGLDTAQVEHLLYQDSGLKGLSGVSSDMQTLLASTDPQAAFAVDYFTLKVAQYTAMLAVSMGGLDALVFTGGIGENAQPVREAVLRRLQMLGAFQTLVIPANEEKMMAIHAQRLLATL
ncbi:MAG: acetate/propionate family kinase [Acidovorax sp.]|nr:MAG: acetate/propionate family kinase [Acidovorax sp.]